MNHGRAFVDGGFRVVVTKEGPKWTQIVYMDGSRIRLTKVKGSLECRPLEGLTLSSLARQMLRPRNSLGLKVSISKGARNLLKEALS